MMYRGLFVFKSCLVIFIFLSFCASYIVNNTLKNPVNFPAESNQSQFPPVSIIEYNYYFGFC